MYKKLKEYLNNNTEIYLKSGYSISLLKKHHLEFYNELINIPLFKNNDFHWKKMIYYILNDLHELQLCKICQKNEAVFKGINIGYSRCCSVLCSRRDPVWKKKSKQNVDYEKRTKLFKKTFLEKYGVENPSQLQEIKNKKKDTCFKNYGYDHPLKIPKIKKIVSQKNSEISEQTQNKIKETCIKKYGVEHYSKTKEYKEYISSLWDDKDYRQFRIQKIKQFFIDNPEQREIIGQRTKEYWANLPPDDRKEFGKLMQRIQREIHSNIKKSKEITNKQKQSLIKNCPEEILIELNIKRTDINAANKIRQYYMEIGTLQKYGVKSVFELSDIQTKAKNTIQEKYGVENISQHTMFKYKLNEKSLNNINEIFSRNFNILNISKDNDDYKNSFIELQCLDCNYKFKLKLHGIVYEKCKCPNCNKLTNIEIIIQSFLDDKNIQYSIKNRQVITPYELDFVIPNFNLAIEANGLYWHSDVVVDNMYHQNKFLMTKKQNIKLLQFFEDDILFKSDIIKSIIYNNLNIYNKRIHGRKCIINKISTKDKNLFLNKNHLMGSDRSNIKLGAYYQNELIAVMTFSKRNITINDNEEFDFEISRFCCKKFYKVYGIASKLFKNFLKIYGTNLKIKSYADLMIGEGLVYEKLGFEKVKMTLPGYFYHSNNKRIHRFTSLSMRQDKTLTERDDMLNQGYYRIFNAGNNKFVYNKLRKKCLK